MRVEINLLPKEKKKAYDIFVVVPLVLVVVLVILSFAWPEYSNGQKDLYQISAEIETIERLQEQRVKDWEQMNEGLHTENYMLYYEQMAFFLRHHWQPPEEIIGELQRLMPHNAQLEKINFDHNGHINMMIYFERMSHISNYMDALLNGDYVQEVEVSAIQSVETNRYHTSLHMQVETTGGELYE